MWSVAYKLTKCLVYKPSQFHRFTEFRNFQKSGLVLRTNSVNHVYLCTWNIKKLLFYSQVTTLLPDVINNLYLKKDDSAAAVYNNEWYPGVVAEVSWILSYITDKLTCF